VKVFGVSGYSKSGKTTVVLALIRALRSRNYTVSTVKGIHLADFVINTIGSDTHRHLEAGAETSIARTHDETVRFWNSSLDFTKIIQQFSTDFVIVEGMKKEKIPKILCLKNKEEMEVLMNEHVFALSGILANQYKEIAGEKVFHFQKQIHELTDLVVEKAEKME
jgi:molybdopterin-guanine dinucleotide biosynthesis adapter protein